MEFNDKIIRICIYCAFQLQHRSTFALSPLKDIWIEYRNIFTITLMLMFNNMYEN